MDSLHIRDETRRNVAIGSAVIGAFVSVLVYAWTIHVEKSAIADANGLYHCRYGSLVDPEN